MKQEETYVGIDVAKDRVDVAVRPTGRSWSVSYDGAGVDDLVAQLKNPKPACVITEPTGGLELPLVAALATESLPIALVNPRQVRDFRLVDGTTGEDRLPGCSGSGALRGSGASCGLCGTTTHRRLGPYSRTGIR